MPPRAWKRTTRLKRETKPEGALFSSSAEPRESLLYGDCGLDDHLGARIVRLLSLDPSLAGQRNQRLAAPVKMTKILGNDLGPANRCHECPQGRRSVLCVPNCMSAMARTPVLPRLRREVRNP